MYYEHFDDINTAISREKQLKKWGKTKKSKLIEKINPEWKFLNDALDGIERMYQQHPQDPYRNITKTKRIRRKNSYICIRKNKEY